MAWVRLRTGDPSGGGHSALPRAARRGPAHACPQIRAPVGAWEGRMPSPRGSRLRAKSSKHQGVAKFVPYEGRHSAFPKRRQALFFVGDGLVPSRAGAPYGRVDSSLARTAGERLDGFVRGCPCSLRVSDSASSAAWRFQRPVTHERLSRGGGLLRGCLTTRTPLPAACRCRRGGRAALLCCRPSLLR